MGSLKQRKIRVFVGLGSNLGKREEKIEELRKNTTECPIKHLDNPRDCYFKSNYRCSWNEDTDRCELK